MRRLLLICLVLAVLVALAAPVGAKPDKPPKPPKNDLDVSIEANLLSANAPGDTIIYSLVVDSNESVPGARINLTVDDEGRPGYPVTVPLPWDRAEEFSVPDPMPTEPIVAELIVTAPISKSDSVSVGILPVTPCPVGSDAPLDIGESYTFDMESGHCYHGFVPGRWDLTWMSVPYLRGGPKVMYVRDHMPGNFCEGPDYEPLPRGKPTEHTISVVLPDVTDPDVWQVKGVCEVPGAGDGSYFATGNPETFVLTAPNGRITATYLGP
jgi:hypothetical protein